MSVKKSRNFLDILNLVKSSKEQKTDREIWFLDYNEMITCRIRSSQLWKSDQ